jgi:predicted amidophosphoribosyltransferase
LHCLRDKAPARAAALFFRLAVRAGWLERWRGTELVVPAPRARAPANDGLILFAELVARALGARSRAVVEKIGRRTQHGLDAVSRRDAPLFLRITPGAEAEVRHRRVLFLDDVRTTGTTEEMAAYCLREAGAGAVSTFALVGVAEMLERFEREGGEARDEREEVHPLLLHLTV